MGGKTCASFFILIIPFLIQINILILKNSKTNMMIVSLLVMSIATFHHLTKVNDKFYFSILKESLPALAPKPGFVLIDSNLNFSNYLRYYDLGHIFYQKYRQIEWYVEIVDDAPSWAKEGNSLKSAYENNKFLDNYSGKKLSFLVGENLACMSTIAFEDTEIDLQKFIKWVVNKEIPALATKSIQESCQD